MSWNINVSLPAGFLLKEDADFVYLYFKGKKVATFSAAGATPEEIEKEARKHQKK